MNGAGRFGLREDGVLALIQGDGAGCWDSYSRMDSINAQ